MTILVALIVIPAVLGSISGLVYVGKKDQKVLVYRKGGYTAFCGITIIFATHFITWSRVELDWVKDPLLAVGALLFVVGVFMESHAWVLKRRQTARNS